MNTLIQIKFIKIKNIPIRLINLHIFKYIMIIRRFTRFGLYC
jgi:hypothetical protein